MFGRIKSLFEEIKFKLLGVNINVGKNYLQGAIIRKDKMASLEIGDGFSIRKNAVLNVSGNGKLLIGEKVFINNDSKINCRDNISIGSGTLIGQNVLFYDHDHDYRTEHWREEFQTAPITIGKNVWIGSGCIILKGVSIGSDSVIAAGTIVLKDVPSNVICRRELGKMIYKSKDTAVKK